VTFEFRIIISVSTMTVTLDLPPDWEARLHDRASAEGVDPGTIVARMLRRSGELQPPSDPAAREAELLLRINLGFTEAFWNRYHHLTELLEAEELSPTEHAEFISMSDQVEAANARRIEAVAALARLRGTTLDETMDQLGLRPQVSGE
jgi:hypothetical protein